MGENGIGQTFNSEMEESVPSINANCRIFLREINEMSPATNDVELMEQHQVGTDCLGEIVPISNEVCKGGQTPSPH